MRNWTGAGLLVIAAWLLSSGLAHRRRVLVARRRSAIFDEPGASRPLDGQLATFGAIVRPIIILGLGYFALKVTVVYVLLDGSRFFSLFDLAGLLIFLAAYAAWLFLKTSYRETPERPPWRQCVSDAEREEDSTPNLAARASAARERVLDPQS
jgi:hypothetical protein